MNASPIAEECIVPVQSVTKGPKHCFFGYYIHCPFDHSGQYLLAQQCDFIGRQPIPADVGVVGMIDLKNGNQWIPIAETRALNWQFGCMPQWLPGPEKRFIYNDCKDGKLISIIHSVTTGKNRILPRPIFSVAPHGRTAFSLNFARLIKVRLETGYIGEAAPEPLPAAPVDDGVFIMDLETGKSDLVISLKTFMEFEPSNSMNDALHYFTHPIWNPDGSRFLFWHRWLSQGKTHDPNRSRLCTADPDGSKIYLLSNEGNSHTIWRTKNQLLSRIFRRDGPVYCLFDDQTQKNELVGKGILSKNTHFTFSPNGEWLLTDTEVDKDQKRRVALYHWATGRHIILGHFHSMPELDKPRELRCDLHVRWSRDGQTVSMDSTHEGSRQMYLLDVRSIVKKA